jgi:N-acetylglucosamine-6-phosphate deacetylase
MKPQYIDLQVNGHGGIDLLSAKTVADVREVSRSLFKFNVAGYLPTIITSSITSAMAAIELIEEVRKNPKSHEALILGIHLEGPFISKEKAGVHPLALIAAPDKDHLNKLIGAGLIKQVTIAPEIPGSLELIKYLVSRDIVVSLGHSNATKEQAEAGFSAGAKTVTHLFNGMPKPPAQGLGAAALERSDVMVQVIVDGVHVSDELLVQTLPKIMNRFIITNDAVAAAGLGTGEFNFGEVNVVVKDGQARSTDGKLAGGVASMDESLARLESLGIPRQKALDSATIRPCELIGVPYTTVISHFN